MMISTIRFDRRRRRGVSILYNSQYDNKEEESPLELESPSPPSLRVGIIGAGSIAFGTASLTASLGHDPMIWSPSGAGTTDLLESALCVATPSSSDDDDDGASSITSEIQSTGALSHNFNVRIARSPKELVRCSDGVLVVALPATGHKQVMEELAPEIVALIMDQKQQQQEQQQHNAKEGGDGEISKVLMHIIISSHASLGAVYFMQVLREEYRQCLQRMKQSQTLDYCNDDNNMMDDDIGVRITAWGTTAITARKTSGTSVNVLTVRQYVDYCTVPSMLPESIADNKHKEATRIDSATTSKDEQDSLLLADDGYTLCTTLFGPRFKLRKGGLLAISLSNLNPQNHLGIVLGNMSRMDPPPPPPPPIPKDAGTDQNVMATTNAMPSDTTIEPWYQGKNITPNIGRLMEALDRERLDIAQALDINVRTIYEHFSWSFHVPMETPVMQNNDNDDKSSSSSSATTPKMRPSTVSEMNQQMHHYLDNDVLGPSSPDSRYVLEDVPYGLVLTVILGRLVHRPAILHESGIGILSAMYGRDFLAENELLQGLGLAVVVDGDNDMVPSLEKWRDMAYSGYF